MKLSVIVPVYNEARTVRRLLESVEAAELQNGVEKEVIVVDDGSTDGTKDILKSFEKKPLFKISYNDINRGKAYGVISGLKAASGDFVIIQDADLEYNPNQYPKLLEPILQGKASIVYGSRFMGDISGMEFINWISNKISNFTINLLYGAKMTDYQTCFKLFKKELLDDLTLVSKRFTLDCELTVKLLSKGYSIYEVPIEYKARKRSEGKKITWGTALENYFFLFKWKFTPNK